MTKGFQLPSYPCFSQPQTGLDLESVLLSFNVLSTALSWVSKGLDIGVGRGHTEPWTQGSTWHRTTWIPKTTFHRSCLLPTATLRKGMESLGLGVGLSLASLEIQDSRNHVVNLDLVLSLLWAALPNVSPNTWFAHHWPWLYKLGVNFMGRWHIKLWVYKWPSEASQVKGMKSKSYGMKKLSWSCCYFCWQTNKNEQNPYFSEWARIRMRSHSDFSCPAFKGTK